MIEVSIHKDINEYQEKVYGGMSIRKIVSIVTAIPIGIGVGALLTYCWEMEIADAAWFVIATTLPIWLLGWWQPEGMKPERYIEIWWQANFGTNKLPYQIDGIPAALNKYSTERNKAYVSKDDVKENKRCSEWTGKPTKHSEFRKCRKTWKRHHSLKS
ncbi:MAG: PrgI family protein [Raoultibacter sp.]